MYGFPRPLISNDVQWNYHHAPFNPQWRPFHGPRAPIQPRNHGFYNHMPPASVHVGSEDHWCETCDRAFPNEDLLIKHKQQHQKCNIDGCQFIAHPKVITKHIQMQHSSGLYKKIAKLSNPQEIEKWKEERRKKYPTKSNIDKKAAELKEKIDRGEKMNLRRSRKDYNNQNGNFNSEPGMKRNFSNANNNQSESKFRKPNRKQTPKRPKIIPAPEQNRTLAPFSGIQHLEMDSDEEVNENVNSNDLIEDYEIGTTNYDLRVIENDNSAIVEKPTVCSALSSLMCEYGSSDDDINDIENTKMDFKEMSNVNKSDKSSDVIKEIIPRQTKSKEATKDLPNEVKSMNADVINENVDKETSQKDNEVSLNPDKVDLNKNNIIDSIEDASNGRPEEIKVSKNENSINSIDVSSISDELTVKYNENLDSIEKNEANIDEDDNDSGPEEVKVDKNVVSANITQENNGDNKTVKKKMEVVRRKPVNRKPKPKLPSTLIYRLLSKEMKQERNKVLQCIRYIRKNNYFDKSS